MHKTTFVNRIADATLSVMLLRSSAQIVFCITSFTLVMSVVLVYLLIKGFGIEYSIVFFLLSTALPLLLTPIVVLLLLRATQHLEYLKKHLEVEIDKNKEKDLVLFEQARFVLMGEMMANISHQWKQPLNTINLAVLSSKLSNPGKPPDRNCDIIEDNVNYLASTIDDFMSFFDKDVHFETRELPLIVKGVKSIIDSHIVNQKIKLNIEIDNCYGNIAIASSISQVLLNLLNNSKDAFTKEMKNKNISLKFTSMEDGLEILCCDNGKGIDPVIREKIFDPYFTTKHKTQGTGIGLYMSRQIVEKVFGGVIDAGASTKLLPSFKDAKTCFSVKIPYSEKCELL